MRGPLCYRGGKGVRSPLDGLKSSSGKQPLEASGENVIGRTSEDQITVVDLTGIAIQDIQIARMVDRALREDKKQTRQES